MSEQFPKELQDQQIIEDILDDPESGVESPADFSGLFPETDTDESVSRFVKTEFLSAVEIEEKEAAIKRLLGIVPDSLKRFGLDRSMDLDEAMIDELMGYGFEDEHDIENLYFHVWDKFREELGPFSRIRPEYMMDFASRLDSDELAKEQNDSSTHALIGIGVDADYALDVRGNPTDRRNMRRLSWIINNEPAVVQLMATLPKPEVASIDVYNLAEYVKNYLLDLKETMLSMDLSKMDNLDRNKHRGQMGMLRCSTALAESITSRPQE